MASTIRPAPLSHSLDAARPTINPLSFTGKKVVHRDVKRSASKGDKIKEEAEESHQHPLGRRRKEIKEAAASAKKHVPGNPEDYEVGRQRLLDERAQLYGHGKGVANDAAKGKTEIAEAKNSVSDMVRNIINKITSKPHKK